MKVHQWVWNMSAETHLTSMKVKFLSIEETKIPLFHLGLSRQTALQAVRIDFLTIMYQIYQISCQCDKIFKICCKYDMCLLGKSMLSCQLCGGESLGKWHLWNSKTAFWSDTSDTAGLRLLSNLWDIIIVEIQTQYQLLIHFKVAGSTNWQVSKSVFDIWSLNDAN